MLTVDRPRFRHDLIAESVQEGGHKFVDLGDPESGSLFRLYEVEFSIACGMDGERDVAGIVQWAKDELGLMPSVNEVRSVIAALGQHGFLDQADAARAAATERPTAAAAAAASRGPELGAGVVVGQQPKPAAGRADVELGASGGPAAKPAQPMPKGAAIELGTPGATATAKPPRSPVEDVALGAPGSHAKAPKTDVSLDLADHMGLRPDDVKEAVRQSKQMSAVDVPKELLAQMETPVPPQKVDTAKPAAKPAEAAKPAAKPVEAAKPAAKPVEKPVEAKPASKPLEKPVIVAEKKPIPTAPKEGVSPVLIILLVLAIGGAGAYFAWRYLIRGKAETAQVTPPPVTPASGSVAAPTPPPVAPPPKGKIEIVPGAQRDILSVFAGNIESIDVTERDVDTSDVIARLVGSKRAEAEMTSLDKEIERRMTTLKNAEGAREKLNPPPPPEAGSGSAATPPPKAPSEAQLKAADAAIAKAQKALEDKQNERGTKEENLEKLYVRAPFEGHLVVLAKPGQKVEENTIIANMIPKPAPTVLFKLDKNMTIDRGLAVPIRVNEKMYTCEVADSNVDGTRVVCRTMTEGLTEGAEATLMIEQQ